MCPPLSCCFGRSPGQLPTLLYSLGRLLLATPDELTPGQRRRLPARLDALGRRYHQHFDQRFAGHWLYTPNLADQLVVSLLARACCRQALREHLPLDEALRRPRHWRLRRRWYRPRAGVAGGSGVGRWPGGEDETGVSC